MEEIDRLEDEYTAARAAVVEHLRSTVVSWYGTPPTEPLSAALTKAWIERHAELEAVAAKAGTRANEAMAAVIREHLAKA